jgi:uncharacterized protein YciW
MALSQDIFAELAEIAPGSPLALARETRDAATRHAQGSYQTLFSQQDAEFPLDERFAVAAKVAKWHNADALAAHYAGFGLADPTSERLTPALNFARLLTFSPVEASPASLRSLSQGIVMSDKRTGGDPGAGAGTPAGRFGRRPLRHQQNQCS